MALSWWKRPRVLVPAGLVAAALAVVGGAVFQPWLLFVDVRVDEAAPSVSVSSPTTAASPEPTAPAPTPSVTPPKVQAVVVRTGELISHEHETKGQVRVIVAPDGSRTLRIENLSTSNGPDLRVWLSAAPVIEGREGWFVFGDYERVELGDLKANQGNQNYAIPESADLDDLGSLTIWCKRFAVSFGASELTKA